MPYEKQTWKTGDTITAEKLNYIEDGIKNNGTLVVNLVQSDDAITLDKTWQEIYDAFPNICVNATMSDTRFGKTLISNCFCDNNDYVIETYTRSYFITHSANGYPKELDAD